MKSKYFPDYTRFQSPNETAEIFDTSPNHLANQRSRRRGFPYLKFGGKVIYDLDSCYEHALAAGSASKFDQKQSAA